MTWTPNRIVALGTGAIGVLLAVASLAAAEGGPQAAGVAAGAVVVLGVADRWLRGWQAHEARQGEADQPVGLDDLADVLDTMDAPGDVVMDAPTLAEARRLEGMDPQGPVPVDPDEVPAEERGAL